MHTPIKIAAYATILTKLAEEEHKKAKKQTFEEVIPKYLHLYKDVFVKEFLNELPPHRPWDHAIELLPEAETKLDSKIYLLSHNDQKQLDTFLEEHTYKLIQYNLQNHQWPQHSFC
jgi:hypothetical protein